MVRPRTPPGSLLLLALLAGGPVAGCHQYGAGACDPGEVLPGASCSDEPDPREANRMGLGYRSGSMADAALHAGVAVVAFAAVGCSVNGCEPPLVCDAETRLCRPRDCSMESPCPGGQACNFASGRCE